MSNSPANNPTFDPSGFVIGFVEAFLQSTGTPGLAVALIYDGQQYFYNFGVENIVSNDPVSKETIFELGSVTKVFTAIMAAFKMSSLDWSVPITNFLPGPFGLSPGLQDVTISQLVTHTSGMPEDAAGKSANQLFNDDPQFCSTRWPGALLAIFQHSLCDAWLYSRGLQSESIQRAAGGHYYQPVAYDPDGIQPSGIGRNGLYRQCESKHTGARDRERSEVHLAGHDVIS